jgi:hypothetical protein
VTQLEYKKQVLRRARRVVVKIGSRILSSSEGIEEGRFKGLVRDLAALHERKKEIVVVSSGAVAAGMTKLGVKERPRRSRRSRRWPPWGRSSSWRFTSGNSRASTKASRRFC